MGREASGVKHGIRIKSEREHAVFRASQIDWMGGVGELLRAVCTPRSVQTISDATAEIARRV